MEQSTSMSFDTELAILPYLLFTVGNNTYGINSEFVRGIETLNEVTEVTGSEPTIRGGVFYQNDFIYLTDMRKLFGLDSQVDEFEKSVQPGQRVKDHENWVSALEDSVSSHTEFKLTDDPHKCAFGKWLYSFKTDNNALKHQLKAIEGPHEAIHNTAKKIKKLMVEQQYDLAVSAIKEMRETHYKTTVGILSTLRETFEKSLRELYIVIDASEGAKGIIVDSIVGVEDLDRTLQMPKTASHANYINFLGQRKTDGRVVIVLNNSL